MCGVARPGTRRRSTRPCYRQLPAGHRPAAGRRGPHDPAPVQRRDAGMGVSMHPTQRSNTASRSLAPHRALHPRNLANSIGGHTLRACQGPTAVLLKLHSRRLQRKQSIPPLPRQNRNRRSRLRRRQVQVAAQHYRLRQRGQRRRLSSPGLGPARRHQRPDPGTRRPDTWPFARRPGSSCSGSSPGDSRPAGRGPSRVGSRPTRPSPGLRTVGRASVGASLVTCRVKGSTSGVFDPGDVVRHEKGLPQVSNLRNPFAVGLTGFEPATP